MAQDYVLITRKGKVPVVKKPVGIGAGFVIRLLDDCLERTEAESEIRTVICTGDLIGFQCYAEREFRSIFSET